MYSISTVLASAINSTGRKCSARVLIDGRTITGEVINMTCKSGCSSNCFSIGSVISKYIELKIDTSESFQDVFFDAEEGFYTSNNIYEYVKLGHFKTYEAYKTNSILSVKAYDKIFYAYEDEFVSSLTYPNTIQSVINEVTESDTVVYKGISSTLLQKSVTINNSYIKRKLLSELAICLGAFVYVDNSERIVFAAFNSGSSISLTADDYFLEGFKLANETVATVNIYKDDNTSFVSGSGKGVYVKSDFMTQTIFNSLSPLLLNTVYNSGTIKTPGNPCIEPCDYISITDANNNVYKFYCMNITHVYNGGFTTSIESYGVQESEASELDQIKKIVNKAFLAADGKTSCYVQSIAPSGDDFSENDIWFATDNGTRMYYWNGSNWEAKQYGSEAIASNSITAEHIVAGAVTAAKINVADLFAQNISFTGSMVGGDEENTGVIQSYNYNGVNALTGFKVDLARGNMFAEIINIGGALRMFDVQSTPPRYGVGIAISNGIVFLGGDNTSFVGTYKPFTARKSIQSGYVTITPTANQVTTMHVDFYEEMAYRPNVLTTLWGTVPGTGVIETSVSSITKTGFNLHIYATNTTARNVNWFAHADVELTI